MWEQELMVAVNEMTRKMVMQFIYENDPPRKMDLTFMIWRKKFLDPDNAYGGLKPVIDVIKRAGLLHDDSLKYLNLKVQQYHTHLKFKVFTRIRLEPAEEERSGWV